MVLDVMHSGKVFVKELPFSCTISGGGVGTNGDGKGK